MTVPEPNMLEESLICGVVFEEPFAYGFKGFTPANRVWVALRIEKDQVRILILLTS